MGGSKNDAGKLRYDLIPPAPLAELAYVYTIGADKYNDWNWLKGFDWNRLYASAQRHLQAWWMGTDRDPDDGQHPLSSVAWCMFALMEFQRLGIGNDNRPHNLDVEGGWLREGSLAEDPGPTEPGG